MRADFPHAAFVHDDDLIAALNRREPVSDDNRRASLHQAVDGFPDLKFRFRIDAGRRFIEDQNLRIVRKGSRECQQLALPDGERGAAFVDGML